jgi:hypothetical protein
VYTLTAENITAKFIPYGARLTSLLVQDRDGNYQDVVAGYDNATQYLTDTESESRKGNANTDIGVLPANDCQRIILISARLWEDMQIASRIAPSR